MPNSDIAPQKLLSEKIDISKVEELDREVTHSINSNFTISKAKVMDNLPDKAQANQRA